jgi:hypothetical protein
MNNRSKFHIFSIAIVSLIFIFTSCDSSTSSFYPDWFDEYSGQDLIDLKAAQDEFECFKDPIGSNVYLAHGATYDEDSKILIAEFYTRDDSDLVDATDIQPFRDAAIAKNYIEDGDENTYVKGDIEYSIYVVIASSPDAHFEIWVELND